MVAGGQCFLESGNNIMIILYHIFKHSQRIFKSTGIIANKNLDKQ